TVAFGFEFVPGQYPLKLSRVYRGSPAWQGGLRAGDRLLKFNDVELTAKTAADYVKAAAGGEGVKLRLTVQHSDQEQPETVELVKVSHIPDDVTVEQIERLLAAVDQQLGESPNHPALLELRAELAGQSSESDRQVADYTAAITALETQEPQPTADLQRLHRRRGDAHVRLKQWQPALDDYAKGMIAETADEELLANRASAQAEVLVADRKESLDNVWFDDAPPAGAKLEGHTPWEIVGRPDHPVYSGEKSFRRQAKGESQHFFTEGKPGLKIVKGGVLFAYVYLDPQDPPQAVMLQFNDGVSWDHRAYWGDDLIGYGSPDTVGHVSMGPLPKAGEWVRLEVPVEQVGLKPGTELSGWAFSQFAGTCYWDRAGITGSWGDTFETPWQKLAAAYRLSGDAAAIDRLVEQRPKSAGSIGDLFTQGDNKDWQRAVALYSRAIAPDTTDAELLDKRARAYEELKDWNAAAADWTRATGESPERVKFLTEFAGRLEKSDQRALADAQRQRARQVLEAALKADPDDAPAADRLAQILLDLSEPKPPEWTALTPAASTAAGATLAVQDDHSIVVEQGQEVVTLPAFGRSVIAIRLETSPEAAPPANGAAAFTEYRLQAVDAPTSKSGAPLGRYVRIDLPGDSRQFPRRQLGLTMSQGVKALSLAEVQVFQGDDNVALTGTARQSSDHDSPTAGKAVAARAVDGKTDGIYTNRSVTHTQQLLNHDPWWEVDLGDERAIDRIVVWNRTDRLGNENPAERLHHFRVQILDRLHRVVFEQMSDDAPKPSREIDCRSWLVANSPEPDGDRPQWSLRLGGSAGPQRIRLATADRLPTREFDHDSSALAWAVVKPTELKSSGGRTFTARDDGSYLVETIATDTLPLPVLPETVRTVRIETASRSGAPPNAPPVFSEYRVQAVGAATDSGTIQGRYVRLDLPGDNQQFPRKGGDGDKKTINLSELQVFRGDENIALRKPARQSGGIDTSRTTADRAVDGNTTGNDTTNSYAHTNWEKDVWWEVDLGSEQAIDRMVVWNRADLGEMPRMNHFRVRVLNASRQVVFEQVIDEAPKPSREILCRSLLVKTASTSDGSPPHWSLRLDKDTGVDPGGRFRISTAAAADSLAREEAIAEARKISLPGARLAAAYDLKGQPAASADWFGRALASAPTDHQRQPVLASLKEHPDALTELIRRQPDDRQLQLAQARRLVQQGGKALSDQDTGRALASLQSARELYEAWLAHTSKQHWTVLTPVEMKAEHGSRLTLQPDGSVFVQQPATKDAYTLVFPRDLKDVRGLRLEALTDSRLPHGGPGWAGNGNFHLKHLSLQATSADKSGPPRPITLKNAQADFTERGWDFRGVVTGRGKAGWSVLPEVNQNHTALFEIAEDVSDIRSTQLTIVIHCESEYDKHLLGRFRLSVTSDAATLPATRRRFDLKDSELTALDVALGKAYAQQKNATEAVAALTRALDRTPEEKDRKPLIDQLPQEAAVLSLLAQQHPQDQLLQLALAKHLAESGKKV
ncbi:MAG TPA: PDZ domain-containing protein, partial [Planctomycetaceae bacterium]|nr:PDZ domain-containing protein [Planctomycetaceae bacterium]